MKIACIALFLIAQPLASKQAQIPIVGPPDLLLEGGRKLSWERTFSSEREVKPNRGFWNRLVDVIAGEPQFRYLVRPYDVATDSRGRVIVTDPGAHGIHIFDFNKQKYKFIARQDGKDPMPSPQCLALDSEDNIYASDSVSGRIFVFDSNGKYRRAIGSLRGGEGYFKRPTGIAVDASLKRIYVTDTLRNQIFVLDMQGNVLRKIGIHGAGDGEFNFPTELLLDGKDLLVVDAMNFRIQRLDREGTFQSKLGTNGDGIGSMLRPKGIAFDSEGDLYVVDAQLGMVQVFDSKGELLYYFGRVGTRAGEFQLPAGIFIDRNDRIFVVDSYNRRIQVFHFFGLHQRVKGEHQ